MMFCIAVSTQVRMKQIGKFMKISYPVQSYIFCSLEFPFEENARVKILKGVGEPMRFGHGL